MASKVTAVSTELDPELLRQLDEKRAETERSRAAEVRMAIKAWVAGEIARDYSRAAA